MGLLEDSPTFLSDLHKKAVKLIEIIGVELIEEVDFPPYRVDCYLPDYHIAVEIDGPQHTKPADLKRDLFLMREYKLPVLHITEPELKNKIYFRETLLYFIEDWNKTVEERWEFCKMRTPWL